MRSPIPNGFFIMSIIGTAPEQSLSLSFAVLNFPRSARSILANRLVAERELPPTRRLTGAKIRCEQRAESCVPGVAGCVSQPAGRAARHTACRREPDAQSRQSAREFGASAPCAMPLRLTYCDPAAQPLANPFA